jgi:extracellular factor (EF) 3-hydroxypalmitic acid methyl ester biosynthesis protein
MKAVGRSEMSAATPSPATDSATKTYERTIAQSPATMAAFWSMSEFARDVNFVSGDDRAIHDAAVAMLDRAASEFEQSRWLQGMELQHQTVASARWALSKASWDAFAKAACLAHPVRDYIHQDPFTRRSFQKPRGYAGDAVLIDYIYGLFHPEHELNASTLLGRWIANYASNTAAPRAVRRRMYLIAELIDRVCMERTGARILSIASGHMREMQISHALRAGIAERVVAFDQDARSLAEVEASAASKSVRAVQGSISRLIAGRHDFADFDLVYAAGLFDYLEDRAAKRLAQTMFDMLRPGGYLLVANFLPGVYDIGYMESFMGWNLIYRDRHQIAALTGDVQSPIQFAHYFEEAERNIGFLLVKK